MVTIPHSRRLVLQAGILLGAGTAALLQGIVLRDLLGWRHVIAGRSAQAARILDGIVELAAMLAILLSVAILVRVRSRLNTPRMPRRLRGAAFLGGGLFVLAEGLLMRPLLGLRHANPGGDAFLYDAASLLVGLLAAVAGAASLRRVAREARELSESGWSRPPRDRRAPER